MRKQLLGIKPCQECRCAVHLSASVFKSQVLKFLVHSPNPTEPVNTSFDLVGSFCQDPQRFFFFSRAGALSLRLRRDYGMNSASPGDAGAATAAPGPPAVNPNTDGEDAMQQESSTGIHRRGKKEIGGPNASRRRSADATGKPASCQPLHCRPHT